MNVSSNNEAIVWIINRSYGNWPSEAHMSRCLTQAEVDRWQRYYFSQDRTNFLKTRYAIKQLLGYYLAKPPQSIDWQLGSYGKPYIAQSPLDFNISHSGDYALLAVGWGGCLGIDIELINETTNCLELAKRFFAEEEVDQIEAFQASKAQLCQVFFHIWTAKESIIKALGKGLSLPLTSFAVDVRGMPQLIRLDSGNLSEWRLHQLDIANGYYTTLTTTSSIQSIHTARFDPAATLSFP